MTRLAAAPTHKINPKKPLAFTYRGRALTGLAGDTIASAMFACGVRIFSRSLKYHRPRGLYSLDGESSNCLMEVDGLANVRAENTYLKAGMNIAPQNVSGSPESDRLSFIDKFDWAMPAGFYYKFFHKPAKLWPLFLNQIRKMAGTGKLNPDWRPGPGEALYLNAEVCILGGGPAGLAAAAAAGAQGLRVVLFEGRPWTGGYLDWRVRPDKQGQAPYQKAAALAKALDGQENIRVFTRAMVNGLWGENHVTAIQTGGEGDHYSERYIEVRAKTVIVATGNLDRPLVFQHNERPGVMQAGAAHRLARTWALLPGRRAVFSVGDDLGLEAATDLADLGLSIQAVADSRTEGHDPALIEALAARKIPFLPGYAVNEAVGKKQVTGAVLTRLSGGDTRRHECDLLVASAGQTAVNGPLGSMGLRLDFDPKTGFFLPRELPARLYMAGRLLGYVDAEAVVASGHVAGLSAAVACGVAAQKELALAQQELAAQPGPVKASELVTPPGLGTGNKSFVCFDEDATVKHIRQASEASFDAPELAKRFTATGTGPGQGGIPGHNLPLLMAQMNSPAPVAPTTIRPPLVPTLFSTYACEDHDIYKGTALSQPQVEAGGVIRRVGVWKRARYFSQDFTSKDEILNVRNNVGLIDVSTLGKFRIHGPDAAKALNRVYVGDMTKVPTGRLKYSAMLNEDGNLVDDGVVTKLAENDYFFTSSTARAGMTIEWIRYHCRYDGWKFHVVNLTDTLGGINVAGPKAREVLAKITDADLSKEAFPYMAYREITLGGRVPARAMRVGFVGELSYELHVPNSMIQTVWEWLMEAGRPLGIKPFGLEAQNVLRLEKGHVIIGQESEIRTTLHDLNMGWAWHRGKPEAKTVGATALKITEPQEGRLKLVGIQMDDPAQTPGDGSLIVDQEIRGYICTSRYSHTLGRSIGLALLDSALTKEGTPVEVFQDGMGARRYKAKVVKTPFYDPHHDRQKM